MENAINILAIFRLKDVATGVAHMLATMCDAAEAEGEAALASTYAIMADALTDAVNDLDAEEEADDDA